MTATSTDRVVQLDDRGVTIDDVVAVARGEARIELTQRALDGMAVTRARIDELAHASEPKYGISTGFGALATRHISPDLRTQLQRSLIRSHAAGMGEPVEREVVRALMFLRLKTLASGRTGIRPVVAETMAALLNAGITPVVREFGSLGCSGDLAPLSHCALVLMGEGHVWSADGEIVESGPVLAAAGITPVVLEEKEGLALINGTDGMLGMLCLAIADLEELCDVADVTAAMSVEALLGTDRVFLPELHEPLGVGEAQLHARQLTELVCTDAIDLTSPGRVRIGQDLIHTLYVSRSPERTFYGWLLHAMQHPRAWSLSVHAHMLDRHQMRRAYQAKERRLEGLNTGRRDMGQRPDRDQERQEAELAALVDQDLATGAESICELAIYQTLTAPGPDADSEELAADVSAASRELGGVVDAGVSRGALIQPVLWTSTLPLALDRAKRTFRTVTRNAADSLPLCSTRCGSTQGLLLGFADPGRTVELLNPFDRSHDNPLTVVFSRSGGGKTSTVINLLTQALPRGAQATVIDRSTGHYEFATQLIPGAAHLQPGGDHTEGGVCLNPWDTPDPAAVPRSKIAFLVRLHALLAGEHDLASDSYGLSPLERNLLAQAIRATYAAASQTGQVPREGLLADTLAQLAATADTDTEAAGVYRSLGHRIGEYCGDGTYGHLLDQETTIQEGDPPLLVFNTAKVPEDVSAAVVFIALEHTLRRVEERHVRHLRRLAAGEEQAGPFDGSSIVVLEEIWKLLARPATRDWVTEQARRGRHLGLWLIGISQQRSDLLGPAGKALLDNATLTLLLKQGREEAKHISQALSLSEEEQEQITRLSTSKGRYAQAYLINGAVGRGQVAIPANPHVYWLSTSDPQHDLPLRHQALHTAGYDQAATEDEQAAACWQALDALADGGGEV